MLNDGHQVAPANFSSQAFLRRGAESHLLFDWDKQEERTESDLPCFL
jgi:hypothetical protein